MVCDILLSEAPTIRLIKSLRVVQLIVIVFLISGCWSSGLGVDPKSILCEFFKVGQCQKGFKCKFSHDLNVQRKGEKIDLYSDQRDRDQGQEWSNAAFNFLGFKP